MAMENGPFEDVFPIRNGNSSFAMLVYWRVQVEGNGTCCLEDPHKNSKQIRNRDSDIIQGIDGEWFEAL